MNKEKELIDKLIDLAFAEDIGDGDHTTLMHASLLRCNGKVKAPHKRSRSIGARRQWLTTHISCVSIPDYEGGPCISNDGAEVKPGDVA